MSNLSNESSEEPTPIDPGQLPVEASQIPNLSSLNIPALHSIIKKLDLSLPQVLMKQRKLKSNKYTSTEKARMLFNLKDDQDPEEYLRSRLTAEEIQILKEAVAGAI